MRKLAIKSVSNTKAFGQHGLGAPRMRQPRPAGYIQNPTKGPKDYRKQTLQLDPMQYGNASFGRTGLTGES